MTPHPLPLPEGEGRMGRCKIYNNKQKPYTPSPLGRVGVG